MLEPPDIDGMGVLRPSFIVDAALPIATPITGVDVDANDTVVWAGSDDGVEGAAVSDVIPEAAAGADESQQVSEEADGVHTSRA